MEKERKATFHIVNDFSKDQFVHSCLYTPTKHFQQQSSKTVLLTKQGSNKMSGRTTSLGKLKDASAERQQIVDLVHGRTCVACPTTHLNTGNIISHITKHKEKPPGKSQTWTGYTITLIHSLNDLRHPNDITYNIYDRAEIIQPILSYSYNHVHVFAKHSRPKLPFGLKKDHMMLLRQMPQFDIDKDHFWCTRSKADSTIYIFMNEIIPMNPYRVLDFSVTDRHDNRVFMLSADEVQTPRYPPVLTPSGFIQITDAGDRNYVEVAQELSHELMLRRAGH